MTRWTLLAAVVALWTAYLPAGCCTTKCRVPEVAEATATPLTEQQVRLNLESFDTIHTTIAEQHYDPQLGGVAWEALGDSLRPLVAQATTMPEAREAMNSLIASLGQSHFVIYPADVYADAAAGLEGEGALAGDEREHSHSGRDGETGIEVRVIDGVVLVTGVRAGTPAAEAGVLPGWEITHIGTVQLAPRLEKLAGALEGNISARYILSMSVAARLAGDEGDRLAILFRDHEGAEQERTLTLGPAEGETFTMGNLPAVRIWTRQDVLPGDIGYFRFNYFMDPTTVMGRFNQAMTAWRDKPGVIVDLRGNPGGLGAMAMGMAGWFAAEKGQKLGTMIMRGGELNFVINRRAGAYEGKVAVLIDGLSASTSEILAGGLKDLDLARLFGSRTAGAALPSYIVKLPNGDGFQYAVANYISEGGEVLEGRGVEPHEPVIPGRENLRTEGDPVREAARRWLLQP